MFLIFFKYCFEVNTVIIYFLSSNYIAQNFQFKAATINSLTSLSVSQQHETRTNSLFVTVGAATDHSQHRTAAS